MFSEIEKKYRETMQERRYWVYYVRRAVPLTAVAILFSLLFRQFYLMIYMITVVILVGLAVLFLVRDIKEIEAMAKVGRRKKGIIVKLKSYFEMDDVLRVNELVVNLAQHGIRTKEDLKIALGYYEVRLPINTKPNLLDWFLATVVTVASVAIVAYDEVTSMINIQKFMNVFISALIVAAICITPVLVFKVVRYVTARFRNRVDTILVEDLAYIYVNFEKYQARLGE